MKAATALAAGLVLLFWSPFAQAQAEPAAAVPPALDRNAARAVIPEVDLYFPEGDLELRLQRLIKNTFVQGQVRYNFVKGDILSLLRYRYYARNRILQIGVFDELNFDRLEERSNDFERVRGGMVQLELPHGISRRAFLLAEVDSLTSNKQEQFFSTDRTNTFLRAGYQIGTPDDSRSNAVVGESRSRVESLFTAYRKIGPRGYGLTGALTWSTSALGDFDYLRLELEGLRRWPIRGGSFVVGRFHAGTFLDRKLERPDQINPQDRYAIPLDEMFRLDGREALKGLDRRRVGTEEALLTIEWFLPWFSDDLRHRLGADWDTWYWVGYAGYGHVAFERSDLDTLNDYVTDLGFGFESSFRAGRFLVFLSGVAAHALDSDGGIKARLTLRSSR